MFKSRIFQVNKSSTFLTISFPSLYWYIFLFRSQKLRKISCFFVIHDIIYPSLVFHQFNSSNCLIICSGAVVKPLNNSFTLPTRNPIYLLLKDITSILFLDEHRHEDLSTLESQYNLSLFNCLSMFMPVSTHI